MNLVLRPLTQDDAVFLFDENKGNVKTYFGGFETMTDAKTWIEDALSSIEQGEKEEWVGEIDGKPVGMIGINHKRTRPEVGLWVVSDWQRKGVGKELLRCLIEKVKKAEGRITVRPYELFYDADAENEASNKVAISCGFTLESAGKVNQYRLIV